MRADVPDARSFVRFLVHCASLHLCTEAIVSLCAAAERPCVLVRVCVCRVAFIRPGMSNTSEDTVRPVLQFLYAKHTYKETKNYGNASLFAAPAAAATAGEASGD